ncbi:MAG: Peptidylprolyl isomerase [Pseudomonadota bacterium]|nr:Peptidylprolyl isomerase [Pseudomonadota bacterium]
MSKPNKLTLSLLALSSALWLSTAALAADDKKPEAAPAPAAPTAVLPKPAAAPAPTFTVPDPVAVVNGTPISKATFDQVAVRMSGRVKTDTPEASKALVDQLVIEELLVQEANKQKLADDPEIKQQLAMVQRNLLASTVIRRAMSASAPSEEAIKKEYETAVAAMKGKEYKAAHILVDSEDKAKEVIAELKKDSSKFAELAKAKSSDSSAANGGDLGWFSPSMMVPPFAQAVAKMEKGKFSEAPVQTPFGWHVILLEDTRDATPPSLDELKPQIQQMLQSKMVNDYLEKLKSGAKIEVTEIKVSEAKPAAPAPEAAAPAAAKEEKK